MARRTPQLDKDTLDRLRAIAGRVEQIFRGTFDDAFQAACETWFTTSEQTPKRSSKCYFAALEAAKLVKFETVAAYRRWHYRKNRQLILAKRRHRQAEMRKLRPRAQFTDGRWQVDGEPVSAAVTPQPVSHEPNLPNRPDRKAVWRARDKRYRIKMVYRNGHWIEERND